LEKIVLQAAGPMPAQVLFTLSIRDEPFKQLSIYVCGMSFQEEDQWFRFTCKLNQWLLSDNFQMTITFATGVGMRPVIPRWKGMDRGTLVQVSRPEG
jgi:hypothetical protein